MLGGAAPAAGPLRAGLSGLGVRGWRGRKYSACVSLFFMTL